VLKVNWDKWREKAKPGQQRGKIRNYTDKENASFMLSLTKSSGKTSGLLYVYLNNSKGLNDNAAINRKQVLFLE